jgi:tetratricopeptide (TPR) repeat protein
MQGGYTSIVARHPSFYAAFLGVAIAACSVCASPPEDQTSTGKLKDRKKQEQLEQQQKEQEPPEEDAGLKEKEYSFNPLQAQKELIAGGFYYKKGNYKASARRYRDATRWDPTSAQAFLRLAQSEEKLKNAQAAREAYAKYLELAPDSKDAESIRKRLEKLEPATKH